MQSTNLICLTFIICNVLLCSANFVFRFDPRDVPSTGLSSKPREKDSSVIHFPTNDVYPTGVVTTPSKIKVDQTFIADQLNMAKILYEGQENAVLSPFLLSAALDILKSGMNRSDCFKSPEPAKTLKSMANYQKIAQKINISLATYLYKKSGLTYQTSFQNHLKYLNVNQTDIKGKSQDLVNQINKEVKKNTKGLIPEIANEEMFTNETSLVLLNTVYFRADWETRFDEEVDGLFNVGNFTQLIKFMEMTNLSQSSVRGYESSIYGLYQFPYNDHRTSMFVVLPNEGYTLENLNYTDIANSMSMVNVTNYDNVKMPKMDHSIDLDVLNTRIGNCSRSADYTKIFTNQGNFKLSTFIHKAKLITSLNGTEATGASAASIDFKMSKNTLLINRPFLYFIHDTQTNAILFYGTYNKPPIIDNN